MLLLLLALIFVDADTAILPSLSIIIPSHDLFELIAWQIKKRKLTSSEKERQYLFSQKLNKLSHWVSPVLHGSTEQYAGFSMMCRMPLGNQRRLYWVEPRVDQISSALFLQPKDDQLFQLFPGYT